MIFFNFFFLFFNQEFECLRPIKSCGCVKADFMAVGQYGIFLNNEIPYKSDVWFGSKNLQFPIIFYL